MRSTCIAVLLLASISGASLAQKSTPDPGDDMPMETYLTLLSQVAPSARDGAQAYMAAFLTRCRRALRTIELRRAFAQGDGDPTLLAMVRAAYEQDTAAIQRLGARIRCPGS